MVLEARSSTHDRTLGRCAELGDGAIQHVDMVEKVDRVDGKPFVEVFPLGEHYSQAEVAATECGFSITLKLILLCTLGDVALGLECARLGQSKEGRHRVGFVGIEARTRDGWRSCVYNRIGPSPDTCRSSRVADAFADDLGREDHDTMVAKAEQNDGQVLSLHSGATVEIDISR